MTRRDFLLHLFSLHILSVVRRGTQGKKEKKRETCLFVNLDRLVSPVLLFPFFARKKKWDEEEL